MTRLEKYLRSLDLTTIDGYFDFQKMLAKARAGVPSSDWVPFYIDADDEALSKQNDRDDAGRRHGQRGAE